MKKILVISFLILLNSFVFAEENPPKVTTQQFDNWTHQCVDNDKQKNCEVRQTLRIQNSNLSFAIVYSRFLNDEKPKFSFNLSFKLFKLWFFQIV